MNNTTDDDTATARHEHVSVLLVQVRLDGICKELEGSKDAQLELKAYYQSRIKEIHSRMENYRSAI